ncbi:hypothetical protein BAE44_0013979, partial [Dichanthelium oligosanthes]
LVCIGFVPVNGAPITPGDTVEPANNGQTKISVKIFKVAFWWLHFGSNVDNLSPVGYWPKGLLLTNMKDHATQMAWGGETHANSGESSPPMGKGKWPAQNSASVQDVQYIDTSGQANATAAWILSLQAVASNKNAIKRAHLWEINSTMGARWLYKLGRI